MDIYGGQQYFQYRSADYASDGWTPIVAQARHDCQASGEECFIDLLDYLQGHPSNSRPTPSWRKAVKGTAGTWSAGMTLADFDNSFRREPNALVATQLDFDGFWHLMLDALQRIG